MNIKKYIIYSSIISLFSEAFLVNIGFDFKFFYIIILLNSFIIVSKNGLLGNKILFTILALLSFTSVFNIILGLNTFPLFLMQLVGITYVSLYYYIFFLYVNDYNLLFKIYVKISYYVSLIGIFIFIIQLLFYGRFVRIESIMNEPAHFVVLIMPAFYFLFWKYLKFRLYKKEFLVILVCIILAGSSVGFIGVLLVYFFGRKVNYFSIFKTIFVCFSFGILIYSFNEDVKMRVDDSVKALMTLNVDGTNISTYALFSNLYISIRNFNDNPLTGTGLGSYPLIHSRYVMDIEGIEYMFRNGNDYWTINSKDAGSLLFRIIGEHGLIGLLILFFFLYLNRKNLNSEKKILSNAILIYILLKLLREGHYFSPDIWFFLTMFYFVPKHEIKKTFKFN